MLLPTKSRATARSRRMSRVKRVLRRTHMYLGLSLLPWVLLYGITALLFNHSHWMSSSEIVELGPDEVAPMKAMTSFPAAEDVAQRSFEKLSASAGEKGVDLKLVPFSSRWLGQVFVTGRSETHSGRVIVDPEKQAGRLLVTPRSETIDLEWAPKSVDPWSDDAKTLRQDLVNEAKAAAKEHGADLGRARVRRVPEVRFLVEAEGRRYACDVAVDGSLDVTPVEDLATLRRKLLRLHVQHGDPGYSGARRMWALLVDVVGIAMVIWSITGIVMWWQLPRSRRTGFLAISGGVVAIVLLAYAVWMAAGMSA